MKTTNDHLSECQAHLADLEKCLASLELGEPDAGEQAIRAAHAIASGNWLAGVPKLGELAQRIERALVALCAQGPLPAGQPISVVFRAIDMMRDWVADPRSAEDADSAEIFSALELSSAGPLRMLLVEDDFTSRSMLQSFLARYGACHVAVNGREAVDAFRAALEQGQPYRLVCMDIMMPELDGGEAVRQIRALEEAHGIFFSQGARIVMTTALNDLREVRRCYYGLCDEYLVKPIDLGKLRAHLQEYRLIP